jgi:hypothetical protein
VYLHHKDGSFGPSKDPRMYLTLLDLQRRGFSIAVRCRQPPCCVLRTQAAQLARCWAPAFDPSLLTTTMLWRKLGACSWLGRLVRCPLSAAGSAPCGA